MTDRFLIVGTGRSGTTYCQAVFRVCGVNVSHQTVFNWDSWQTRSWDWGDSVGEASFMAVPLLPVIVKREPGTAIILVRRAAERVVASWLKRGLFGDDMGAEYPGFTKALNELFPHVLRASTPQERGESFVHEWNTYAAKYADVIFDLETMGLSELFHACNQKHMFDPVLAGSISKTINTDP